MMRIKYLFIISCVFVRFVEMKTECSEQFRCLSELLKDFIKTYQKFDTIVKETRHHDNQHPETTKTIEVATFYLNNFIKQIIYLFKLQLDGQSSTNEDAKTFKDNVLLSLNAAKIATDSEFEGTYTAVENNKNVIRTKVYDDNSNRNKRKNNTKHFDAAGGNDVDDYYDSDSDNTTDYLGIDYIEIYKDTTNEPLTILTVSNGSDSKGNIEKVKNDIKGLSDNVKDDSVQDNNPDLYVYSFPFYTKLKPLVKKTAGSELLGIGYPKSGDWYLNLDWIKNISNMQHRCTFNGSHNDLSRSVFPWIATIFIKNGDSQQFEYYCDGVILSDRIILTAAQCVVQNGTTVDADDIIVVLGKRSLLLMSEKEKVVKIKKVIIHVEFKKENNEATENDIAFIVTEDPFSFNDVIQPACVMYEDKFEDFIEENLDLATTGWAFSGELTTIMFDKEKSRECDSEAKTDNVFCANYNNDVTVCPSYGSGFVTRATDNVWYLRGLRTGDPAEKGFCYNTGVFYTDLIDHVERIKFHLHEYL